MSVYIYKKQSCVKIKSLLAMKLERLLSLHTIVGCMVPIDLFFVFLS